MSDQSVEIELEVPEIEIEFSDEEQKEKSMHYVPYGVTSFGELDELEVISEKSEQVSELTYNYNELVWNVLTTSDEPVSGLKQLNEDYLARLGVIIGSTSAKDKDIKRFKQAIKPKSLMEKVVKSFSKRDSFLVGDDLLIFKSSDGTNRWVGRYSNNYRDNDNPPEIISKQSHENFVRLVDYGLAMKPKLLLWHEKSLELGQSDWVAYDDAGFALAGGHFHPGTEEVVETIKSLKGVGMSHGMPPWSIERDENDSSVITAHVSEEITLLPIKAAANKRTGFMVFETKEETNMITDEKRQELKEWGISSELIEALETRNAKEASLADQERVEKKDVTEEETPQETDAQEPSAEEGKDGQVLQPNDVTEQFAKSIDAILKGMIVISERLEKMETSVKELRATDEEKIKAKAENTPLASMTELMKMSVIGKEETRIDGRTTLAKSEPEETAPAPESRTGIPFVDALIHNANNRGK